MADNYHVLELIGEGSFGKVYKGRKKYTGQIVAIKFIPKVGKPEKELRNLRREIDIMRNLHHENIIEMLDSFDTDKEVAVVTDYAEGELFQILEDDGNLPEEQVQHIAAQLVSALYYLHSHRILHRDMKPQNILLGKGGIVKLCDFGFARAMSFNTLVLTSIKGTPLYMSPELVEEKPYDHTADLWALGCILYELFTGTPPFYTNSIFQLVSLIIKDPVKWPKNMSPNFKDFLQGVLTKNPKQRLAWPELLHHPFIAELVKVKEEDANLPSPFTQPLTASMMRMKDEQAKEKAHPKGTSKILAKARKKAMEEEEKKGQGRVQVVQLESAAIIKKVVETESKEAWGPKVKSEEVSVPAENIVPQNSDKQHTKDWENTGISKVPHQTTDPTPRADRITKDYEKEYPSIEIEGRRTIRRSTDNQSTKNIENVKLDGEEVDSDDEWQGLIEATHVDAEPQYAVKLLTDKKFLAKLSQRIEHSSAQVLDGMLEGASRLRTVLQVVTNLVTLKCDFDLIINVIKGVNFPTMPLKLLTDILDKAKVKQQPWCQQILVDLVIVLNAYFASEISWTDNVDKQMANQFLEALGHFMSLLPKLMNQQVDEDLRLREQSILCTIYTCEAMERDNMKLANQYFTMLSSKHTAALDSLMAAALPDTGILRKLTELADGNEELAMDRHDTLTQLSLSCLATMLNIPLELDNGVDGRRKIAHYLGDHLASKGNEKFTDDFLILIRNPPQCSCMLKVIYACCQVSTTFCSYISNTQQHMESLLGVLMGKIDLADMEVNSVIEMLIHVLSTIVIQLQTMPPTLTDAATLMVSIFLESTIASHTAAAALLFSQMVYCGVSVEVQPEEMLQACLAVFTDLQQICVRCPFDYGILDGLMLLLCEMLIQADAPVAQLYIEIGIWGTLWHRVAQALQVMNPETELPIHDIETDAEALKGFHEPDWSLVSPQGLMAVLQMSVTVFTKETQQCIPNLAVPDSIIMLTLIHLLRREFLHCLSKSFSVDGPQLVVDLILEVTQICCFPFAVDTSEDLLSQIQICLHFHQFMPHLMYACQKYLKDDQLETPIGLISRLVLSNNIFVQQFCSAVNDLKYIPFMSSCMSPNGTSISVVCDIISLCNHLVRTSAQHIPLVQLLIQSNKDDLDDKLSLLITHQSSSIKSRLCSLLGNLMKHNVYMYAFLKQRDKLMDGLIACLKDEDQNVRKGASYAVGNAAFHNDSLYIKLKPTIPQLVELLKDPVTKTRVNAACALGNLGLHSGSLCAQMKKSKVVQSLVYTACHDNQPSVQISAILALRTLSQQEDLRKEMSSSKTVDKLSELTSSTPRPSSATPRSHSVLSSSLQSSRGHTSSSAVLGHCNKLINILQGNGSR